MSVQCWYCGEEVRELYEVHTLDDPEPRYVYDWPRYTDHEHADIPPSPEWLVEQGRRILHRLLTDS